jgi:hypothetical protein
MIVGIVHGGRRTKRWYNVVVLCNRKPTQMMTWIRMKNGPCAVRARAQRAVRLLGAYEIVDAWFDTVLLF